MPTTITVAGARAVVGDVDAHREPEIEGTPLVLTWEAAVLCDDGASDDGAVIGASGLTPKAAHAELRARLLALRAAVDHALDSLAEDAFEASDP